MTLDDFVCEFNSHILSRSNHISLRINLDFKNKLSGRLYSVTLDGPLYHKIFSKPPHSNIYYMSNSAFSFHKAIEGLISKINNCNRNDQIVVSDHVVSNQLIRNPQTFIVGENPISCGFGFFLEGSVQLSCISCRTIKFNFDVEAAYFQLQENEVKFALIGNQIERLYE